MLGVLKKEGSIAQLILVNIGSMSFGFLQVIFTTAGLLMTRLSLSLSPPRYLSIYLFMYLSICFLRILSLSLSLSLPIPICVYT